MNGITERNAGELERLDVIALRTQNHAKGAAYNLIELGHDFAEAKELVPHGEWEEWVRLNSGMSVRYAQQLMQAWGRFGSNTDLIGIGTGKLMKLLSLPDGSEDAFLAENDVNDMTARQVEEAVRKVRSEMQAQIDDEKRRRIEAENAEPMIPTEITDELRAKDEEIQRLRDTAEDLAENGRGAAEKNRRLMQDVKDLESDLADKQQECDEIKRQLLDAKSDAAHGDGDFEKIDGQDILNAARQFVSVCAEVPYMGATFAHMKSSEKTPYQNAVSIIAGWLKDAGKALNTLEVYGE